MELGTEKVCLYKLIFWFCVAVLLKDYLNYESNIFYEKMYKALYHPRFAKSIAKIKIRSQVV